ncbi:hypothetical protein K8Q94_01360 [Candidatus Nomurabacteria bacterium]|nr:hypothetical protein [Candidatus Nomurabacteria bacterium]
MSVFFFSLFVGNVFAVDNAPVSKNLSKIKNISTTIPKSNIFRGVISSIDNGTITVTESHISKINKNKKENKKNTNNKKNIKNKDLLVSTFSLNDKTEFLVKGIQNPSISDFKVGDNVTVFSKENNNAYIVSKVKNIIEMKNANNFFNSKKNGSLKKIKTKK